MTPHWLRIVWPAFLMAAVLEALVFAVVDPAELHWWGGAPVASSSQAIYTLSFLVFWGVISTASALTQLLSLTAETLNHDERV